MSRRRILDALFVTVFLTLAACGGSPASNTERTFVAQMIPHHELGMELIDIATTRADDVRLRRLVFEMSSYHHSDMEQLATWQSEWNVSPSVTFPGALPSTTLTNLTGLAGPTFDVSWLEAMITHHKGALDIANAVLDSSDRDAVTRMARTTINVQSREIDEMVALRVELCGAGCP